MNNQDNFEDQIDTIILKHPNAKRESLKRFLTLQAVARSNINSTFPYSLQDVQDLLDGNDQPNDDLREKQSTGHYAKPFINEIIQPNLNRDQIIVAEIRKHFKDPRISTTMYRTELVSFDRDKLVKAIEEKYSTVLIKDPKDDFPYFTDGGFKYSFEDANCIYETVALIYDII